MTLRSTSEHGYDNDNDHAADDQLHLLTLCLELQLDLLLVALRPDGEPRWDGDVLDLTGEPSVPGPRVRGTAPGQDPLSDRYAALADAIGELLENPEVRRRPAVVSRLLAVRATCDDRLAARPLAPVTSVGPDRHRPRVEAGHFLG